MSDLIARLRVALDEQDRAITAWSEHLVAEGACRNFVGQSADAYDEYDSCALHIALSKAVLFRDVEVGRRMVSAHRKLLDLHANDGGDCSICHTQSQLVVQWDGEREAMSWESQPATFPCATVLALAEGYGIEP